MAPAEKRPEAVPHTIEIGFTMSISGSAEVRVRRSAALPVDGGDLVAMERRLERKLEREYSVIRRISRLLLRVGEWRREVQGDFDVLAQKNVAMHVELECDESELAVEFVAEYVAADLRPLVHKVKFPIVDEIPASEEVVGRLRREWATLKRVFTIASTAGRGAVTMAVPPPFLESKHRGDVEAERDHQLRARAATPEEAKRYVERYLDNFRFPIEVEEGGVRYGFIPRVGISEGGSALKLTVTLLAPPASSTATFMKGGSRSVAVPLSEIYVQDDELNRKTKEGFLELIKGLCRSLGRERGLTGAIDITRPR